MSAASSAPLAPSTRLLLAVGVLLGAGVAALGGWEFADAEDRVIAASTARSEAAGADLGAQIDAPYLEVLATILPDRESVWSWDGHGSDLQRLHTAIQGSAERHGFERVRTLRPRDEARELLQKDSKTAHRGALVALVTSSTTPDWQKPADYLPEMRETWRHGKPTSRVRHSRKRGVAVETWVALVDRQGAPLALLELTDNVDAELAEARRRAAFVTTIGLLIALGTTALAGWEGARADQTLTAVRRALRRFAAGDLRHAIRGDADVVLRAAEQARQALSTQIQELQARLDHADGRLRTSEAMMDHGTQERREAIARVACGPVLVIDAGGSRREQAELVDLSFAHLVIRVQRYTMIDLAPGMPASISWIDAEELAVELVVDRRTESAEGVEYVFAVPGAGELPGTPPEIACIAFARVAERASAEFTEVTGTLLAGLGGPLVASILDLSADGAGIQLPVPPSALAATGTRTTFLLQLGLGEEELTFGVILRSVRPAGDGCVVGMQFDPEMTGDYEARRARVEGWVSDRLRSLALAAAGIETDYAA